MSRPTVPSVGDLDWGELLRSAIFDVSDRVDAITGYYSSTTTLNNPFTPNTTMADAGMSVTITVPSTTSVYLVTVTLDVQTLVASPNALFNGALVVNNVQQSALLVHNAATNAAGYRTSISQSFIITGQTAGNRVFKIQAQSPTNSGAYRINSTTSTMNVVQVR